METGKWGGDGADRNPPFGVAGHRAPRRLAGTVELVVPPACQPPHHMFPQKLHGRSPNSLELHYFLVTLSTHTNFERSACHCCGARGPFCQFDVEKVLHTHRYPDPPLHYVCGAASTAFSTAVYTSLCRKILLGTYSYLKFPEY